MIKYLRSIKSLWRFRAGNSFSPEAALLGPNARTICRQVAAGMTNQPGAGKKMPSRCGAYELGVRHRGDMETNTRCKNTSPNPFSGILGALKASAKVSSAAPQGKARVNNSLHDEHPRIADSKSKVLFTVSRQGFSSNNLIRTGDRLSLGRSNDAIEQ